ncbi:MAG: hypothetical protein RIC56_16555 [Pseudomonadales bacterium]
MPPHDESPPQDDSLPGDQVSPRRRTLILVHGGGYKPTQAALEVLWRDALAAGLDRDFAAAGGRGLLDAATVKFVYYGDLVNPLCERTGQITDLALDLEDRRGDLDRLARLSGHKKFRRVHYEALPGKSALGELMADVAAPLTAIGLAPSFLSKRVPSLGQYLADSDGVRERCEARLLEVLVPALAGGDDVMLVSHGLGSVIGYDVLWRLTCDAELAAAVGSARVRSWITLGSPLASEFVKRRLRGAAAPVASRHPNRMINWYNVAAEDDYLCHDKTVSDDFAGLLKQHHLSRLRDYRIYNLAIRYGRSNPHNSVGYLIHPRVTRLLADWLMEEGT